MRIQRAMATAEPRGLLPSPSTASAPGRLDEALGAGPTPSLPWLVLLAGALHRAFIESGSGAGFPTIHSSRAAFPSDDRSPPPPSFHIYEEGAGGGEFPLVPRYGINPVVRRGYPWAGIDEPSSLATDRFSPPPSCRIDEEGGVGEDFPLVARYDTNAVFPRRDAWARISEPDSLPDQDDTCLRIWEADGFADGSQFQRWSYPVDHHPCAWAHMHDKGGLTLHEDDGDGLSSSTPDGLILHDDGHLLASFTPATLSAQATEAGNVLIDEHHELTQAEKVLIDELQLINGTEARKVTDVLGTKTVAGTSAALRRGCMGGLPQELVIKVARHLVRLSLQDAIAMKLTCKSWNAAFEISGPLLVVARQDPASPAVTFFKIVSQDTDVLALVPVDCLYPPANSLSLLGIG